MATIGKDSCKEMSSSLLLVLLERCVCYRDETYLLGFLSSQVRIRTPAQQPRTVSRALLLLRWYRKACIADHQRHVLHAPWTGSGCSLHCSWGLSRCRATLFSSQGRVQRSAPKPPHPRVGTSLLLEDSKISMRSPCEGFLSDTFQPRMLTSEYIASHRRHLQQRLQQCMQRTQECMSSVVQRASISF